VSRRVARRMQLYGMTSASDYLSAVVEKETEASVLASDIMIGVTSFFRDRVAWKALRMEAIRKFAAGTDASPLRVWAPACATGEEVYSLTMMISNELELAGNRRDVHVFATDINDRAIEKAREGDT
jgi:two-component system CheB/CheR fusion protein